MLHRGATQDSRHGGNASLTGTHPSARVLIAVAPPPRVTNPTRWGWPHWLAPTYKAGGHRSTHRPLEDYA
jgi:hypothetical protein